MDKKSFLERYRLARQEWQAALAPLSEAQMLQTRSRGEWSVKDVIAHLTWHEREMIGMLQKRALVGSPLWNLPLEQRNAAIYEANKGCSLAEVHAEAREVFQELWQLLEALEEEDLQNPRRFAQMPPEWIPLQVLAGNTYEHYEAHLPQVEALSLF
jgi:uncharacterized damage-inducible protein DinB